MHLLFVSNYFPPEVNAPATRLYEHARQWVADGNSVEVLTAQPNFPEGEVYPGYRNAFGREEVDGIAVTRVPMYIAENKGTLKRSLSYLSFMITSALFSRRLHRRPDIVVGTSPQFFCALGAYLISRLYRVPFVLEVRDLWPESILAVGAMQRNALIRMFERVERYLYRKADHIVALTDAFKSNIVDKGIDAGKITVLKNGADLDVYDLPLDEAVLQRLRREYDLEGCFVASYIGTVGLAHRADVMLEAARLCDDPNIVFMVVGGGAEKAALADRQAALRLPNVRLVEKQPRDMVPYFLSLSDVSVVHLMASPLFRTVIPSKIFESMAMGRPIVLGVEGEARDIIEAAGAGVPVPPEDPAALSAAVQWLCAERAVYTGMANDGRAYVRRHHDRRELARTYWQLLRRVCAGNSGLTDARALVDALSS